MNFLPDINKKDSSEVQKGVYVLSHKGRGVFLLDLKVFPIDLTSNQYNRRYSLSFGDYWLDLFSTD